MTQSQKEVEREQEVLKQQELECRKFEARIDILTKKRDALEKKKEMAMKKVLLVVGLPVPSWLAPGFVSLRWCLCLLRLRHGLLLPPQMFLQAKWGGRLGVGWLSMGEGLGSWHFLPTPCPLFRAKKQVVSSKYLRSLSRATFLGFHNQEIPSR